MRKRRHPEPEELAAPGAESSGAGVDPACAAAPGE